MRMETTSSLCDAEIDQCGYNVKALLAAITNGNIASVRELLERGQKIEATRSRLGNALEAASWFGRLDVVQQLLDNGADANFVGGRFKTPLIAAAYGNHAAVIELLFENGADVNETGHNLPQQQILLAAIDRSNIEIVQLVLNRPCGYQMRMRHFKEADAKARLSGDETIKQLVQEHSRRAFKWVLYLDDDLERVCREGNRETASRLLAQYAITQEGTDGIQARKSSHSDMVKVRRFDDDNALSLACGHKNTTLVQTLISKGADINALDGSALVAAVHDLEIVQILASHGFDFFKFGARALVEASYDGREKSVLNLLERGVPIDGLEFLYGTALNAAAFRSQADVVKLLLDRGANVNITSRRFGSALHAAAFGSSMGPRAGIIKTLSEYGADINAMDDQLGTPLHVATYRGDMDAVRLLLDLGADVNASGGRYGTILQGFWEHHERAIGNTGCRSAAEIIPLLVEHGAVVSVPNIHLSL